MEFLPDTENNARNVAFLNKTKNQAKKLFKLAKQNQLKIEINNLSHAQEILAQINGFPDWHALEKTINNAVLDHHYNRLSITSSNEDIADYDIKTKNLEIYKGVPILRDEYSVMSIVSLNYVSSDYSNFINFMDDIIKATSFQFNMEFHKVSILIEQRPTKREIKDVSHEQFFRINNHKALGLHIEGLKDFTNFGYVLDISNTSDYSISAQIMISTDVGMIDEHIKFCNIFISDKFKDLFYFKEVFHYDNDNNCCEIKHFNFHNGTTLSIPKIRVKDNDGIVKNSSSSGKYHFPLNEFLTENKMSSNQFNHNKWIFALYLLSQRKHQWKLNINLLDLSSREINYFTLNHSENENNDMQNVNNKYLQGLYKSLTSDNFTYYEPIDNSNKKIFPYKNNLTKTLPWISGIPLINREDNIVDFFQPGSSEQSTWVNAIYAKPGSGKSILLNMINLGLCFSPGIQRLPRIGIVDIGPSSSGLISLLKESLPIEKRHLVQYHKLRMIEEYCVNIFDTQLGSRFPTSEHRSLLTNMLLLLLKDVRLGNHPQGMSSLVQAIIDDMYLQASERGQPKRYDKGINSNIDTAIQKIGLNFDFKTTWWEVVDALFKNNMFVEAAIAQRYAVPLLIDATVSSQRDHIREIYGDVKVGGESLIKYFNRTILDALNHYKILGRPTVFDISDARIVSLDLDELAHSGSDQAAKKTAIMYMLARYILGKNFKLAPETVNEFPYPSTLDIPKNIPVEKYKAYHRQRIEESKEDFMQLCFDEFHRVSKFDIVQEQVLLDIREGRKWNLGVTVASQSLDSFDNGILHFATGIFIMDGGNEKDCSQMIDTFLLNSYEADHLKKGRIHGPRSGKPGTMLAKFKTNSGNYSKLLSLPLNNTMAWCFSTVMEDVKIREKMTRIVGYSMAINLLCKHYPVGIRKIMEMRKEDRVMLNQAEQPDLIIETLINDVLTKERIPF